jgi:hypothetical protein
MQKSFVRKLRVPAPLDWNVINEGFFGLLKTSIPLNIEALFNAIVFGFLENPGPFLSMIRKSHRLVFDSFSSDFEHQPIESRGQYLFSTFRFISVRSRWFGRSGA